MASVRIQRGLCGLLGMLWLLSALSITSGLELYAPPIYLATCGKNESVDCVITAETEFKFERFYWMEKKEICDWPIKTNQTDFECATAVSKGTPTEYFFSLIIFNVQPKHKGTYHCKLRSKVGVKNAKTILRVQRCAGKDATTAVTTGEGTCTFKDVFPRPDVEWKRGPENLTHLATTTVTENAEGLFTAVSTIKLRRDPTNPHNYSCSLLLPFENQYNETVVEAVRTLSFSGGNVIIAHWFGLMLATLLGMLMV